jgi:23S rRNA pseudouridine1911/1915/1917 synthase
MPLRIEHELTIPDEYTLQRVDQAIAQLLPQYSRSRLQQWLKSGAILIDGSKRKPKEKVFGGERVVVDVEEAGEENLAEDIPLDVVYEDDEVLVINKPPGLVVHPGAGNPAGTLLNALLAHCPDISHVPRAGIVHRLDKETSGLLVVAKTLTAQNYLVQEIQERRVNRIYHAIVYGRVARQEGSVEGAIGRHPVHRKKMAIRRDGKPARTWYRVLTHYLEHTLIECRLDTGRTHQIRVHMQELGYPLVGDPTYGGHFRLPKCGDEHLSDVIREFSRQALHARKLGFVHPVSGKNMSFQAPYPEDYEELLDFLDDWRE